MSKEDTSEVAAKHEGDPHATESPDAIKREEITTNNDTIEPAQVQEDEDEDDFGAFSDASFNDFEEPPAPEEPQYTGIQNEGSKFPQSLFDNKDQLKAKLEELMDIAFPVQPQTYQIPENTAILNERSQHLLERLISLLYLKPYNWQRSSLRRQLLITLGLPDHLETTNRNRTNTFNAEDYLVKPFKELNINHDERERLISETDGILEEYMNKLENDEQLQNASEAELDAITERYEDELDKVETLLSVWEDEKAKLEEDNTTFESVVENLVGHTQRLRREETLKALKKEKKESKRFSLFRKSKR